MTVQIAPHPPFRREGDTILSILAVRQEVQLRVVLALAGLRR